MSRAETALRVANAALRLAPVAFEWIRDRLESGETEDDIRRDIMDRRVEIAQNRAKRDREFEEKFGRSPAVGTFGETPAGALGGPLEEGD